MASNPATDTPALVPAGAWTVDPQRSTVGFTVRNLRFKTVRGRFSDVEGTLRGGDAIEPLATSTVKVASIDTGTPRRDEHLRSPAFFHADQHPEMTLTARGAERQSDGSFRVDAELTIKGATRPVELTVDSHAEEGERLTLHASGRVHRYDFGVKAPILPLELAGFVIGREIDLDLHIEATRG